MRHHAHTYVPARSDFEFHKLFGHTVGSSGDPVASCTINADGPGGCRATPRRLLLACDCHASSVLTALGVCPRAASAKETIRAIIPSACATFVDLVRRAGSRRSNAQASVRCQSFSLNRLKSLPTSHSIEWNLCKSGLLFTQSSGKGPSPAHLHGHPEKPGDC